MTAALALAMVAALAAVNVFGGRLRFLDAIPRSRWLSAAGGSSVAYVFLDIFPELAAAQEALGEYAPSALAVLEHHFYLVALVGLAVFYGLERLATTSKTNQPGDQTSPGAFWIHIGSFAIYEFLIAYLLINREEQSLTSSIFFFIAMLLHFLVNDHSLRRHHKDLYARFGRWLLTAALALGMVVAMATELHRAVVDIMFAFIAGGVILNVVKEELPAERESSFPAFAIGVAVYSAVLIVAAQA